MPKVIDRTGWVLLDRGQDQAGWLEYTNVSTFGCFWTYWRKLDGSEREWRERLLLGPHSLGKKAARTKLRDEIRRFFEQRPKPAYQQRPDPDTTFSWLLDRVKATREADWKPTTKKSNEMYLGILRTKLGHIPVREFATVEMQDYLREWLQELASAGKSKSYIQHTLIYLRAALNEGVKRQLIHYNFASEIKVPKNTKPVDQRFVTDDDVALLSRYFRERGQHRDALIVEMLFLCALRPAELFALKWDDWDSARPGELRIDENFGKAGMLTPKTERSAAMIALPERYRRNSPTGSGGQVTHRLTPSSSLRSSGPPLAMRTT